MIRYRFVASSKGTHTVSSFYSPPIVEISTFLFPSCDSLFSSNSSVGVTELVDYQRSTIGKKKNDAQMQLCFNLEWLITEFLKIDKIQMTIFWLFQNLSIECIYTFQIYLLENNSFRSNQYFNFNRPFFDIPK